MYYSKNTYISKWHFNNSKKHSALVCIYKRIIKFNSVFSVAEDAIHPECLGLI